MIASYFTFSKIAQLAIGRPYHALRNKLCLARDRNLVYRQFHSQFGEDRFIFENINVPPSGVFVDVGAGHPIHLSNTYFFEKNGWSGVCIDANPRQCDAQLNERACVEWAAVTTEEGEINLHQPTDINQSTTLPIKPTTHDRATQQDQVIKVPAKRLETILDTYGIGKIDLLDIDVEGSELDVWQSFDYSKHEPSVVIIEYLTWGVENNAATFINYFAQLPYALAHTSPTNFIFTHASLRGSEE